MGLVGRARHLVKDSVVRNLAEVGTLDFGGNTDKCLADSLLGRGIEHLLLDLGVIRRPRHENNFVARTLIALLVFEVVHRIAALGRGELRNEVVKIGRLAGLGYNDLGVVGGESEDDELHLLTQFQRLELLEALLVDTNSGRLR